MGIERIDAREFRGELDPGEHTLEWSGLARLDGIYAWEEREGKHRNVDAVWHAVLNMPPGFPEEDAVIHPDPWLFVRSMLVVDKNERMELLAGEGQGMPLVLLAGRGLGVVLSIRGQLRMQLSNTGPRPRRFRVRVYP